MFKIGHVGAAYAPVSLCEDYGGTIWAVHDAASLCVGYGSCHSCLLINLKPLRGVGRERIGAVHLSVFVWTMVVHVASLCVGYGSCTVVKLT